MPSKLFQPGLLEGQVAVVSGAGSGLGRASALAWLVPYLGTPAGDYFSGAVLTLDDEGRPVAEERKPKQ